MGFPWAGRGLGTWRIRSRIIDSEFHRTVTVHVFFYGWENLEIWTSSPNLWLIWLFTKKGPLSQETRGEPSICPRTIVNHQGHAVAVWPQHHLHHLPQSTCHCVGSASPPPARASQSFSVHIIAFHIISVHLTPSQSLHLSPSHSLSVIASQSISLPLSHCISVNLR